MFSIKCVGNKPFELVGITECICLTSDLWNIGGLDSITKPLYTVS